MERASDPLSAADLRHANPPLWLYGVALLGLVVLGYAFGETAKAARLQMPGDVDLTISAWVRANAGRWPWLTQFFQVVTVLGNFAVGDCLILMIALELVLLHRERIAGIR